jgi:hypothetical protein
MESLEHWGLFLSNQVDKNTFIETILWEILHRTKYFYTKKTEPFFGHSYL